MISLVADQTRREHVKLMEKTKKGSGTTDLTVGRPLPQILKFALPQLQLRFHLSGGAGPHRHRGV